MSGIYRNIHIKNPNRGNLMLKRFALIIMVFTLLFGFQNTALVYAQEEEQIDQEDAAVKNNAGLGGLFADSIKNLLKSGEIFYPNGATAKAIESATPGGPEKFKLNFNNSQIDQVLKFLSDMTKKLVLKTPDVKGQFTIMNPNEVTKEEAMHIIDTAFRFQDITFEETDQMIIVLPLSAAKQRLGKVTDKFDESIPGSQFQNKIIHLEYASPTQLKEALTPLVTENSNIIADDRTNTLVITDTMANITRLESIIKQLDQKGAKIGASVQVFKLRYLSASEIARNMEDILVNLVAAKIPGDDKQKRRTADDMCEVLADRSTNSLILSAPQDALDTITDYIDKMDTSSTVNLETKTVALVNADASQVAQGLQQFTMNKRNQVYHPVVFADSRTNSIVIHAYPEDVKSISEVLSVLDHKKSYDKLTRVYVLENADAIVISQMIKQLLTDEDSNNNNRSYYYSYYSSRSRRGDEENQIKIVEDQRLNALIVTAKPSDFPMVEDLIDTLDQPLPNSKEEPRVYPVKNVRATDLAYMLDEIFSAKSQNNSFDYFYGYSRGNQQQQQITGFSGKIKTIADPTTNSLIVLAATPRAFGVIEKLIEELDRIAPEFGTTKVYPLKNADAGYLATQLNDLFQEDRQNQGNRGFYWYTNQQSNNQQEDISNLIGNVRIVSETRTNSLLVTTSSQYFDSINTLINDLDREISQVLVEILIVEIIDVKDDEWGIDWGDKLTLNAQGTLDAPISGMNFDRAAILSTAKYDAAINILASNAKTNVIARPNILAGDNQRAFVEVINRIPRLSGISQGNVTTTQEIEYEEVGLKLYVSPHINDASTVTIEVDMETGQILEQFALVTPNGSAPAFSRRKVETRLTIKDQETAVLSGVIDTSFTDSENGIPGLMHIPVLGHLFKTKGKRQSKTELLTFITPYILASQEDRFRILENQSDRIKKYDRFKEIMKDIDVRVGVH